VSGVDLVRWLGAQLDEDERIAREAPMEIGQTDDGDGGLADVPARWVPSHHLVMREPLADDEETRIVTDCAAFGGRSAAVHIAGWDPARVLREIDAKRRMIGECERAVDQDSRGMLSMAEDFLRLLAVPFADRPGFREEWRS
jgi:uncharacterized protein DUF6221